MKELSAKIQLVDGNLKKKGTVRDLPEIIMDYAAPLGGGEGYLPTELFLVSLADCFSTAFLVQMKVKFKRSVTMLEATASGVQREKHPQIFEVVNLNIKLSTPDGTPEDVERAMKNAEEYVCVVAGMIKGNVELKVAYEVV